MSSTYVIRVTCAEDGTDETLVLTAAEFRGITMLADAVNKRGEETYWYGPGIFVLSKNSVPLT